MLFNLESKLQIWAVPDRVHGFLQPLISSEQDLKDELGKCGFTFEKVSIKREEDNRNKGDCCVLSLVVKIVAGTMLN